ncbi:MAG TPA: phosphoadenosine phosphosulfate reductase family protein [Anaerolineae bacterium]|nr:phosphoadenosine phosphosulfate reductase family protein [Anaerolineae bacterium]
MAETPKRFVSFSGGADSTALAIYLADKGEDFTLLMADTGAELPETYWIAPRVARALGKPLVVVSAATFFQRLTARGFMLPGIRVRWCTRELKQIPLNGYVKGQGDILMSIGIRADEADRLENGPSNKPANAEYDRPLVDAGMGKKDVLALCESRDLLSPAYQWRTNTSCFCCPFQRKRDWRNLQTEHPNLYALAEDWEDQSSLSSVNTKFKWSDSFSLRQLRLANEQQMEMFKEPRGEACAICQW